MNANGSIRPVGTASLACAALLCVGTTGFAADEDPRVVYRQQLMQAIGANTASIMTIVKHGLPLGESLGPHAEQIASASALIESAFAEEIVGELSDAEPEIWSEWGEFVAAAVAMSDESDRLVEVAMSGDTRAVGGQMRSLGKACGSCHKPYRKPKEASYKLR